MVFKFFEFNQEKKFEPIKSFYLKDSLNSKIWSDDLEIDENVREGLLQLAEDYIDHLDIDVDIDDIIFTGSLANFNWSDYSDFDVHIIFDFTQINEDIELVKKFLDASEKLWKQQHDILILGYETELYCQNSSDKHISSGQFSLMNNEWIKKPSKDNFVPDEELIKIKADGIMSKIDDIEVDFIHHYDYKELSTKLKKVWKKIKDNRQKGLDKVLY